MRRNEQIWAPQLNWVDKTPPAGCEAIRGAEQKHLRDRVAGEVYLQTLRNMPNCSTRKCICCKFPWGYFTGYPGVYLWDQITEDDGCWCDSSNNHHSNHGADAAEELSVLKLSPRQTVLRKELRCGLLDLRLILRQVNCLLTRGSRAKF